ncbi:MAG: 50S ribosomal protein L24 [Candidatus Anoxychlamydiales bacterium]|nr:50S ribosomal protein L24 [Candidatus Anoxychlamydiales bacterium]NGX35337.1 50S ribosomal protein L24 [Candidatus Anoxychlamydiales bacterium]
MSKWIKKDDRVVVIAGNDKGKAGIVLSRLKNRVIVQGINMRKKHMKKTQQTQTAQIIEIELSIHISNVAFCSNDDKPVKVKVKTENNERKLIYFDKDKEVVLRVIKTKVK